MSPVLTTNFISRNRAEVARQAHNLEVIGSNPISATNFLIIYYMRRLNSTAKLAFYNARKRSGDTQRIADMTGYSTSHITNITNGARSVNEDVADAMYSISRRRQKNSEREMA